MGMKQRLKELEDGVEWSLGLDARIGVDRIVPEGIYPSGWKRELGVGDERKSCWRSL